MSTDLIVGNPKNLSTYLEKPGVLEALAKSAAGNIDPQRVAKIVCRIAADPKNKKLLECTMSSLYTAVSECVSLGLEPRLGRAYFVPYGKECTFILGYQGMLDLARNGGVVATVHAVFEGDEFAFWEGTEERIEHRPNLDGERNKATFKYAYVVSKMRDGSVFHTIMNKSEIDAVRRRSKAGHSGPWETDYVEMAKKTVVRRAAKNWPLSVDAMETIERDDERVYAGQSFDITAGVKRSATDAMKARLFGGSKKQTAPESETIDAEFYPSPAEEPVQPEQISEPVPPDLPNAEDLRYPDDTIQSSKQERKTCITDAQNKRLWAIARNNGWSEERVKETVRSFGFNDTREINPAQYKAIVAIFELKDEAAF